MSKLPQPKILVAMPAYNEQKYIGSLVLKARQYGDEVLIVDDGSTDDTSEIATLAGATVIRHEENKGYGAAVQSILEQAKRIAPDVLVIIDADSQHTPDDIPALVEAIQNGFDVVIGSRELQRSNIPAYRRFGQRILLLLTRLISKKKLSDSESGFRAFSKNAVATLDLREQGMAVSAETVAIAADKGLKITDVPISIEYTRDGSTLNPVRHGLSVLNALMSMISERRPLFFFGLIGSILTVVGLLAGVRVLYMFSDTGIIPIGTALISVLSISIGIFSMFTGLVLHVFIKSVVTKRKS